MAFHGAGLPGQVMPYKPRAGVCCDICEGQEKKVPAEFIMRGETDSFGSEFIPLCKTHLEELRSEKMTGNCDWCGRQGELVHTRDHTETGGVYRVCKTCEAEQADAIAKEAAQEEAEH